MWIVFLVFIIKIYKNSFVAFYTKKYFIAFLLDFPFFAMALIYVILFLLAYVAFDYIL